MTMVVVGLLALGAVTAAATTLWNPQLGDDRRGHPVAADSSPPADQLERLAVLRRDATAEDHGEEVRFALSRFSPEVGAIRTDFVRLLGTYDGGLGVVLVPAVSAKKKRDKLCLSMRDAEDGTGIGCYTTSDVLAGHALIGLIDAPPLDPEAQANLQTPANVRKALETAPKLHRLPKSVLPGGPMTVIGLVPDGVARVRWNSAEVIVKNNFFTLTGPESGTRRSDGAPALEWFDSDGKPVAQQG
jgi:hypothetical protein